MSLIAPYCLHTPVAPKRTSLKSATFLHAKLSLDITFVCTLRLLLH